MPADKIIEFDNLLSGHRMRPTPIILGVPMRTLGSGFELSGVNVQVAATNPHKWVGTVRMFGVRLHFDIVDSPELAALSCERAIGLIKKAAGELGK